MVCLVQWRRWFSLSGSILSGMVAAWLLLMAPGAAVGQVHGVPPSVTSIQFHVPPFLPNIRPSVTSLGPYRAYNPSPFPQQYGVPRGRCSWGCRHKTSYGDYGGYSAPIYAAVPYYYDAGDSAPYLYSGPSAEQPLHVVVDLPPGKHVVEESYDEPQTIAVLPSQRNSDEKLIDVTVLVFRDGHRQEISNYAIMGQMLYIFDARKQKIGLGDLDIPSTIKVNEDRGVDFKLPADRHS